MKNIAIVYHDLPLYRYPIFHELCLSTDPIFTLFSESQATNDIKTIDKLLAGIEIADGGLRWRFIKNVWLLGNKFLWQKGIIKICMSNEFDKYIFLGNAYYISTWISTLILRIRNKKVYFWTHGIKRNETGIKKYIRLLFYNLPNGLLLYGNQARNLLIMEGFLPENLHVIYNSLDYKKQKSLRETLNREELRNFRQSLFQNSELPQLIYIGRLITRKKLNMLIEAQSILHKDGFYINLILVGDGVEKENLQKMVNLKQLNDFVFFYGASYDEAINCKLIASSDICVSPGEIGLTAMHSLVYGTPVITHSNFKEQSPEFEAIVSGFSGCFFEQNNIEDLADKIKTWLTNHLDKVDVKQNCYSIIDSKYNPENQKEIICDVLMR